MKKTFICILLLITFNLANSQQFKYVNAQELNVREGAGTKFGVITTAFENDKVTIISQHGKWSEIETIDGSKGFVSTKFLSNSPSEINDSPDKNDSILKIIILGLLLFGVYKARNIIYAIFGAGKANSRSAPKQNPIKTQSLNKSTRSSAVYRFRIKGNGSVGGVKYVDGMNIEVAVSGLGAQSPFNNIVEKLFVQEFARKYNIEPRFQSGIKMLFKRDHVDVEVM